MFMISSFKELTRRLQLIIVKKSESSSSPMSHEKSINKADKKYASIKKSFKKAFSLGKEMMVML